MNDETAPPARTWLSGWRRVASAVALAAIYAVGAYLLLQALRPAGLISVTFLLAQPAATCAFLCYCADPWGQRPLARYLSVPFGVLAAAVVIGAVVLREGVICILMMAPLWLFSGCLGAWATFRLRQRIGNGQQFCLAVLALPVALGVVEPLLPVPAATYRVERAETVGATPDRLWPLLRGIPDVHPGEGRWNVAQDLIGIPRPLGARLEGEGIGADRFAVWGRNIRFREKINNWQPGHSIGWSFLFDQIDEWRFTDRHLMPNSPYFTVTRGGYRITPLGPGRSRVAIWTEYRVQTQFNPYVAIWGELLMGGLETNLLGLVSGRAEQVQGRQAVTM